MTTPTSTENVAETQERAAKAVAEWAPGASIGDLEKMKGGRSSITYVAPLEDGPLDRIVLKVAPASGPSAIATCSGRRGC